jgi:hypothetical protein
MATRSPSWPSGLLVTYTISDRAGPPATANVIVELIPVDGTNEPPGGVFDDAETGAGVRVVIDVLLNDIDPNRDPLQIDPFDVTSGLGEVTRTLGPSDFSALAFSPLDGFEGTVVFTYRPLGSYGAVGDDVSVSVEVASSSDENRPPVVRPDSVRLRSGALAIGKIVARLVGHLVQISWRVEGTERECGLDGVE